jgi:hypothetical protein
MYTFVDFTSQIVGQRGVPCPTNKGVSYTNLVCVAWSVTLKIDYYYYYYYYLIQSSIVDTYSPSSIVLGYYDDR